MEKSERIKIHFLIVHKIAGNLFVPPDPAEIRPLGPEYIARIKQLNKIRGEIFDLIISDLNEFDQAKILQNFDSNGNPTAELTSSWANKYRDEIKKFFGKLPTWYNAPLFRTRELADFEHWARSEYLTLDEIVWLSVGLEPIAELVDLVKPYDSYGNIQTKGGYVGEHMRRHKETLRRKFDPHGYGDAPDLEILFHWIKDVRLEVHPEFLEILELKVSPPSVNEFIEQKAAPTLDGREKASMAKLIAAMAIDCYGFDPKALRSDVPMEIQGIANRLGLSVSVDTIRKYLKQGSEMLPDDFEPE